MLLHWTFLCIWSKKISLLSQVECWNVLSFLLRLLCFIFFFFFFLIIGKIQFSRKSSEAKLDLCAHTSQMAVIIPVIVHNVSFSPLDFMNAGEILSWALLCSQHQSYFLRCDGYLINTHQLQEKKVK